jgi:hypothetical protein
MTQTKASGGAWSVNSCIKCEWLNERDVRESIHVLFELFLSLALQHPWALGSDFQFHDHFTDVRTPCMSDQLVARPLPKHMTTQTQNKYIHI